MRELLELKVGVRVNSRNGLDVLSNEDNHERRVTRIRQLLRAKQNTCEANFDRTCTLEYNLHPIKINANNLGQVASMDFSTNDNKIIEFPAQLIITCIGYCQPDLFGIKYDSNGILPNIDGKIVDSKFQNCYTAGWAALGAKGNLASTLIHSHLVADKIAVDFKDFNKKINSV